MHSTVQQEALPCLTVGENVMRHYSEFAIDAQRLKIAAKDAELTTGFAERTIVNFTPYRPDFPSTYQKDSPLLKFGLKLPRIILPALHDMGIEPHQAGYAFQGAVNTHPTAIDFVRKSLLQRNPANRKRLERLDRGDFMAFMLGAILRDIAIDEPVPRASHRKKIAHTYINGCIDQGKNNPWLNIIQAVPKR